MSHRKKDTWDFPIPDYAHLFNQNSKTLKRYLKAYFEKNHPGWIPVRMKKGRIICERK